MICIIGREHILLYQTCEMHFRIIQIRFVAHGARSSQLIRLLWNPNRKLAAERDEIDIGYSDLMFRNNWKIFVFSEKSDNKKWFMIRGGEVWLWSWFYPWLHRIDNLTVNLWRQNVSPIKSDNDMKNVFVAEFSDRPSDRQTRIERCAVESLRGNNDTAWYILNRIVVENNLF